MNTWEVREKLKELDFDTLISLPNRPDEETYVWAIIELGNRKEVCVLDALIELLQDNEKDCSPALFAAAAFCVK